MGWDCGGGWGKDALSLAVSTGVPFETDYPYKSLDYSNYFLDSVICDASSLLVTFNKLVSNTSSVKISAVNRLSSRMADSELQAYLNNNGTFMVTVDASSTAFRYYSSGILACPDGFYTHEVQLVGYNKDAWIVKNSWGTGWGENGFGYISRV